MKVKVNKFAETSFIISSIRKLLGYLCLLYSSCGDIYRNSQTYKFKTTLCEKLKVAFRFSFLGRISEIRQEETAAVLDNSKTVRYLISTYNRWRDRINYYLNASSTVNLSRRIKEEFCLLPVKMAGILIVGAIVANIVLLIISGRQITLLGWLVRGLLLFFAFGGLFCSVDLRTVASSSILLRWIRNFW
jgi:hypothetical protein